jgi:hypothetical protein
LRLCVIPDDDGQIQPDNPYNVKDVADWDRHRRPADSGEYVFVSYTRLQYQTYGPDEIDGWSAPETDEEEQRRQRMKDRYRGDVDRLYQIGTTAAQKAKVRAFWIDVLCMSPDVVKREAHRICDVVRGANRMVIALKDTLDHQNANRGQLLENWASRLWTLPEMLLSPIGRDIDVYRSSSRSNTVECLEQIPKRNMARRAYTRDGAEVHDTRLVRQLIDHFESNLHLAQAELLTIGLECLMNRGTKTFMQADPIYALMTLARRRPQPKADQSLFEAFAELSLLNDCDMLLERLICTLPRERGKPWHSIEDFWDVKLWDIFPTCQVAGIVDHQSVLLDGAFGASIEWSELTKTGFVKRKTFWRYVGEATVRGAPSILLVGIMLLVLGVKSGSSSMLGGFTAFFVITLLVTATVPYFLLFQLSGKFWSVQALLIGVEGKADLEWLETELFGLAEGRLKWAPYSSTQSVHGVKTEGERLDDECEALEPLDNPLPFASGVGKRTFRAHGGDSSDSSDNGKPTHVDPDRLFTLVDTYSMTATVFRAVHPPSVALICGHEGGMRRALLCSYDYNTQAFHRETVIRMPTKVLDRMDRVDRFRFSMESMPFSDNAWERISETPPQFQPQMAGYPAGAPVAPLDPQHASDVPLQQHARNVAYGAPAGRYPFQQYPLQQYPLQQYPSQQHPSQQHPSQQHPSQQYPSQQYPSQQYPSQHAGQHPPQQVYYRSAQAPLPHAVIRSGEPTGQFYSEQPDSEAQVPR